MGLDMYLTARRYLWRVDEKDGALAKEVAALLPELASVKCRFEDEPVVKELSIEAGYWRKANHIHRWFVENVQGGEDECNPHDVTREQLEQLRDLCKTVLADRAQAPRLLPTASGFFFGGTDYNDYYFQDLEQTVSIIDQALTLPDGWDFEYCSSW